jgi:hypothetical protein
MANPRHLFLTDMMKAFDPTTTPLQTTKSVVSRRPPSFLDPVPRSSGTRNLPLDNNSSQPDPAPALTDLPHATPSLPFPLLRQLHTMSVLDPASDDDRAGTVAAPDRRGARRPRSHPEPLQAVVRQDNDVGDVMIHDADNDEIDPLRGMPRLVPRRPADVDDDNDDDDNDNVDDNIDFDFDACDNENDGNMPRLVPTWAHENDVDDRDNEDQDYGNSLWQLPLLHVAGPGAPSSTSLIRDLIERWPDGVEEGDDGGLPA